MIAFIPELMGIGAVLWIVTASQRFKYRQIGFVNTRRDGVIALSLWLLGMILEVGIYTGVIPIPTIPGVNSLNLAQPLLSIQPIAALVLLVVVLISMAYRRQPPKSAGWNRLTLRTGAMAGLALALLTLFLRAKFNQVFGGLNGFQIEAILLVSLLSLAEETVFRGYLQLRLVWWLGKRWGMLLTAALFVIWQLPLILSSPQTMLVNLGLTVAQSLLLVWMMDSFGNVSAPILYRLVSLWCAFL